MAKGQLSDHSFVLDFGVVAEVYQEAGFEAGGVEVVEELGLVFGCEIAECFYFKDDFVVDDEIGYVLLFQGMVAIRKVQFGLYCTGYVAVAELDLEAFLVD